MMIDDASVGGGQKHVLCLASELRKAEFEVAVASEGEGYLVDELKRSGIRHFPLAMSNVPSAGAFRLCRKLMKEFRPQIVHTHGGTAGVTGRLAAATVRGVKIVHTYHGLHYIHDSRRIRRGSFRVLESALLRVTDRIICVAEKDVETGAREGIIDRKKTVVIRNGIDPSPFEFARSRKLNRHPVIGTIGRLHPQKGHKVLLEAAKGIGKSHPRSRFLIVGEGEMGDQLKREAVMLSVADKVTFAGARTDIPLQLKQMDLFVFPSLWEGLPIVLLEAMAAGLPIVATDVDGVQEILQDGKNALLIRPGDARALQEGIERMLDDARLRARLGDAARRTVRQQFSVGRMMMETEKVYRSLLS